MFQSPKAFVIEVSPNEWSGNLPIEPEKREHKFGLRGEFTDLLYEKFFKHCFCCITFTQNRARRDDSRKVNAPYYRGVAKCKLGTGLYNFLIHKKPSGTENVCINVQCQEQCHMKMKGRGDHSRKAVGTAVQQVVKTEGATNTTKVILPSQANKEQLVTSQISILRRFFDNSTMKERSLNTCTFQAHWR